MNQQKNMDKQTIQSFLTKRNILYFLIIVIVISIIWLAAIKIKQNLEPSGTDDTSEESRPIDEVIKDLTAPSDQGEESDEVINKLTAPEDQGEASDEVIDKLTAPSAQ